MSDYLPLAYNYDEIALNVPSIHDKIDEPFRGIVKSVRCILRGAFSQNTPTNPSPRWVLRDAMLTVIGVDLRHDLRMDSEVFLSLLEEMRLRLGEVRDDGSILHVREYYQTVRPLLYEVSRDNAGFILLNTGSEEDKQVIGYAFTLVIVYAYVACMYSYGRENIPSNMDVVLAASSDQDHASFTPGTENLPKLAELFDILCCLYYHARLGTKEAVLLAALWCVGEKHLSGSGSKKCQGNFLRASRNMNDYLAANQSVVTAHVSGVYGHLNQVLPAAPSPQYTFPPPSLLSILSTEDVAEFASCLPFDDEDEENASHSSTHHEAPWPWQDTVSCYHPYYHFTSHGNQYWAAGTGHSHAQSTPSHHDVFPPSCSILSLEDVTELTSYLSLDDEDEESASHPFTHREAPWQDTFHFHAKTSSCHRHPCYLPTPHGSQPGDHDLFYIPTDHMSPREVAGMDHGHRLGGVGKKRHFQEVIGSDLTAFSQVLQIASEDLEREGLEVHRDRKGANRGHQVLITEFFSPAPAACSSPCPSPLMQSPTARLSTTVMRLQSAHPDPHHPHALHGQSLVLAEAVSAEYVGNENIDYPNFLDDYGMFLL